MTILRCSQKLLKRLRQPATPPGPVPGSNPLGEWCADIDFIDRQPFALLMNAATGTVLVLPARAAALKRLHAMAAEQLGGLLQQCGIGGAPAEGELDEPGEAVDLTSHGHRSPIALHTHTKTSSRDHLRLHPPPALQITRPTSRTHT